MHNGKYLICCDFDGVLHSYTSGWQGAQFITDPPVPGAMAWLELMTRPANVMRFEVNVYSSRSKEPGAVEAMKDWLMNHLVDHFISLGHADSLTAAAMVVDELRFPTQKPPASLMIDDRAFHFVGAFPTPEWMLSFQPWYKQSIMSNLQYDRPSHVRLEEIATALGETPYDERDSHDHAIGELLTEISYLRGGNRG